MAHYKISDVAEEVKDRENNPSESKYDRFVGLEHYVSGDVEITHFGSTERLESAMKVFKAGDILIARRNVYLKRASTVSFDGLTSGDSIVLRAKDPTIARILPFVLNTDDFWDYADQYSDGTMSKRLSPKLLLAYEFDLPDDGLEDFADLLWAANETRNSYRELLRQTDELVKSQFIEMFGDCIRNDKEWNVRLLQDVLAEGCRVTYGIVKTEDDIPGGVPVFRPVDISQGHVPTRSELKRTSKEISDQYKRTILNGDELLITIRGSVGETFQISKEFEGCNVARNIVPLRANTEILLQGFLKAVIDSVAFQEKIASITKGVALKGININEFKVCPIILPPIEMQQQWVEFAQQSDKSKFVVSNRNLSRCSAIQLKTKKDGRLYGSMN